MNCTIERYVLRRGKCICADIFRRVGANRTGAGWTAVAAAVTQQSGSFFLRGIGICTTGVNVGGHYVSPCATKNKNEK